MKRWLGPADALLQQAAWWTVVLSAARGEPRLATLAGAAVVGLHLLLRAGERRRVAVVAVAAGAFGFLTDSLLVGAGLVLFAGGSTSPPWMVGLWAAFGVGLTASLRTPAAWPATRLALVAALAGPIAYRAGGSLDAISFPAGTAAALAAIAVQWAVGVPLLALVARRVGRDDRHDRGADRDRADAAVRGSGDRRVRWAP